MTIQTNIASDSTSQAGAGAPQRPHNPGKAEQPQAAEDRAVGVRAGRRLLRACWASKVRLAGRMAGNARNNPPTIGPKRAAIKPAATVTTPPKTKRRRKSRGPFGAAARARR